MSKLRHLRHEVDPYFVQGLEQIVQHAKQGAVRGAVILLNYPTTYAHWRGGHMPFETALVAMESWKWEELHKRFSQRK